MKNVVRRFVREERGATAIEYALIASLIAVVIVTAVMTLGVNLGTKYNNIASKIQ